MRRLWAQTIWAKDAIPLLERKYAGPLKWFVFPVFDALMITLAVRALFVGIPSIDTMFPDGAAKATYALWAVFGVICLTGAVFPRLAALEIAGKIALFILLLIYLLSMRNAPVAVEGARDGVSLLTVAAMLIPCLRLWILGIEVRGRRNS